MLGSHPAGALRGETEFCPSQNFAGEDTVTRAQRGIEFGFGNVAGDGVDGFDGLYRVDRKTPQFIAQVAPCLQIPVVAVVRQPLRRDFALAGVAVAAGDVFDAQPSPFHERGCDVLEVLRRVVAGRGAQDADAAGDFVGGIGGAFEHAEQALAQRADVFGKQAAGVEGGEQLLHAEQGVDFAGREPDAGEFVAFDAVVDAVGAGGSVAENGNVHAFLEVAQIAVQCGARDFKALLQLGKADAAPGKQHAFNDAESFGFGHAALTGFANIITVFFAPLVGLPGKIGEQHAKNEGEKNEAIRRVSVVHGGLR